MSDVPKRKCRVLKELLAEKITSGKYAFDQIFPGIRQITEEYHVCYITAAKVLKMLTDEGYLRCRNGVGHFVNYVSDDTPIVHKKVNIITNHAEYNCRKEFFQNAVELFRSRGWNVQLLKCPASDISPVAQELNDPEAYSIICGLYVPWQHFQASFGHVAKRVLILGSLSGNSEVASVVSDEYATIQLAMKHFEKQGRTNIAIFTLDSIGEISALRLGAWKNAVFASGHTYEWAAKHCFSFSRKNGTSRMLDLASELCRWLQNIRKDTDGLIVSVQHAAAVSACIECGIRIPDELSILLIALTHPVLPGAEKYLFPGEIPDMDVLDHNYAGHFQCALEILEERFRSGTNAEGYWYFCPPGTIQKCRKE